MDMSFTLGKYRRYIKDDCISLRDSQ